MEREVVEAVLPSGARVCLEVLDESGEEEVSARIPEFSDVLATLKEAAGMIADHLVDLQPTEIGVEFGVAFSIGSGKLSAVIVDGRAEGNLRVSLKWNKSKT